MVKKKRVKKKGEEGRKKKEEKGKEKRVGQLKKEIEALNKRVKKIYVNSVILTTVKNDKKVNQTYQTQN